MCNHCGNDVCACQPDPCPCPALEVCEHKYDAACIIYNHLTPDAQNLLDAIGLGNGASLTTIIETLVQLITKKPVIAPCFRNIPGIVLSSAPDFTELLTQIQLLLCAMSNGQTLTTPIAPPTTPLVTTPLPICNTLLTNVLITNNGRTFQYLFTGAGQNPVTGRIDGGSLFTFTSNPFTLPQALAPGSHSIILSTVNEQGGICNQVTAQFNVAGTTPITTTPAVTTPIACLDPIDVVLVVPTIIQTTPVPSTPTPTTPIETTPVETTPPVTTPAITTPAETTPVDNTVTSYLYYSSLNPLSALLAGEDFSLFDDSSITYQKTANHAHDSSIGFPSQDIPPFMYFLIKVPLDESIKTTVGDAIQPFNNETIDGFGNWRVSFVANGFRYYATYGPISFPTTSGAAVTIF